MKTRSTSVRRREYGGKTSPLRRQPTIEEDSYYHSATSDKSDEEESPEKKIPVAKKPEDPAAFRQKVVTRTVMALAMIGCYMAMITSGHLYCILAGVFIQFELFRELVNVRYIRAREKAMPLFRTLQWAYFLLAMVGTYGDNLHSFFMDNKHFHHLTRLTENVDTIVFALYCTLFIATVLTFKKGLIRFQLGQLMWTFVTVFFVVYQVKYIAATALAGLFWFFFPMATVVMNDVSAYFCGITMGRKFIDAPFISLSPNKTWEGFIGAGLLTVIFSFFFPWILAQFQWFTCPADDIYIRPWVHQLSCTPHAVFQPSLYLLPDWVPAIGGHAVTLLPIQLHGISYGLFASLVAPFGGFMASAIKRAYNIKDFEALIPGHGGFFDRMDCQLLMISFTWVHYANFVAPKTMSITRILSAIAMLSTNDQLAILKEVSLVDIFSLLRCSNNSANKIITTLPTTVRTRIIV